MNVNLLNLLKDQMDSSLIKEAGRFLGEDDANTEKAFGNVLPTLLGGLASKSATKGGAESLLGLLNDGGHDGSILNNLGGIFGGGDRTTNLMNAGSSLMSSVFGSKLGGVASLISKASGVSNRSSSSLMSMMIPVVMGLLGKVKNEQNLDANGLGKLLQGQSQFIKGAAPAGLASALGLSSFDDIGGSMKVETGKVEGLTRDVKDTAKKVTHETKETVNKVADKTVDTGRKVADTGRKAVSKTVDVGSRGADAAVETTKKGGNMLMKLLPLLLLPLLLLFGWNMMKGKKGKDAVKETTNVVKKGTKTTRDVVNKTGKAAGDVANKTGKAVGSAAGTVTDAAGNVVDETGKAVGNAANNAGNAVGNAANNVGNAANNAGNKIGNAAGNLKDKAGNAANKVGDAASDAGKKLGTAIKFPPGSAQAKLNTYLTKGEGNGTIAFRNIDFTPNTAALLPTASPQMNDIVKLMNAFPKLKIQVAGKTGDKSAGQAAAVKTYLESKGISGSRISTTTGTAKHITVKVTGK